MAVLTAYSISYEHKMKWFRQRKDNGFMVRRGVMGNYSLLVFVILPLLGYDV